MIKTNKKGAKKKTLKSRHFPCPDWIQNVTVTCKRSHFIHIEKMVNVYIRVYRDTLFSEKRIPRIVEQS